MVEALELQLEKRLRQPRASSRQRHSREAVAVTDARPCGSCTEPCSMALAKALTHPCTHRARPAEAAPATTTSAPELPAHW